jgi:hypothetical protein
MAGERFLVRRIDENSEHFLLTGVSVSVLPRSCQ